MRSNPSQTEQALIDAVARNAAIVLSLPSAGIVRNIKTRFLADTDEGIWVELDPDQILLTRELIEREHLVAISFKAASKRLSFLAIPLQLDDEYQFNAHTTVPALRVKRPTEIKGVQRRATYRVGLYPDCELRVRIWSITEHAHLRDRPKARQEIKATLRDLSVGGMGCVLVNDEKSHRLIAQQRLRVQLKYQEDVEILLEGRLRSVPKMKTDKAVVAGVTFKKLDIDIESRKKLAALTRIVGDLQREEVRRARLDLAS